MRKRRTSVTILIVIAIFAISPALSGCARAANASGSGIVLAGSTSVQPFAELLAEDYARRFPDAPVINVQGGGSTAGIEAALSHTADLGMSSRDLKDSEKAQGLIPVAIAHDAIAIVVHPSNPVQALTSDQVRRIFDGEISDWSQVGGLKGRIVVVTREEGSGTRGAFEELLMKESRITDAALRQDSNGAVRVIVGSDPAAIGYMSLGIVGSIVKTVSLDGVMPTPQTALSGRYALVRPFLFVHVGQSRPEVQRFVDYVLSPPGQAVLANEGLIPVNGG